MMNAKTKLLAGTLVLAGLVTVGVTVLRSAEPDVVAAATDATVPAVLANLQLDAGGDRFEVRFTAVHRGDPVWLDWKGRLEGTADGRVRFEMDGVARSTFLRNRIGLCVLHPVEECAGAGCAVETADGTSTGDAFPRLVSPHQPFLGVLRHWAEQVAQFDFQQENAGNNDCEDAGAANKRCRKCRFFVISQESFAGSMEITSLPEPRLRFVSEEACETSARRHRAQD